MKVSKIAVLLLLTITVIYAMFLTWSFIKYNTYVSTMTERYEALGMLNIGPDLCGITYFWYGKAVGWIGVALTVSWVFIWACFPKK